MSPKSVARSRKKTRQRQEQQRQSEYKLHDPQRTGTAFLTQLAATTLVPMLPLTVFTAIPMLIRHKLWLAIWRGNESRAWDGTGHSAIAQIYSQSIFPDTFGWTNAYFVGMPFPNFYPPVFYWCVALIHHTQLVSFANAFKVMVAVPMLLLPAAIWFLGWFLSNRNQLVAAAAALACVLLLIDVRFMGALLAGLDYFSTFQIGLYTQPLGFILLTAWFIVYSSLGQQNPTGNRRAFIARPRWKFALSSVLLALTVLANFFNATTAVTLIVATLICDGVHYHLASETVEKRRLRQALLEHVLSPLVSVFLTLFWIVPLLNGYQYFVTRPYVAEPGALFTRALIAWYGIAAAGIVLWLRNSIGMTVSEDGDSFGARRAMYSYLGGCTILGIAVIFASIAAPGWFPLQTPRFLATLTFMLSIPVGYAFAMGFRRVASVVDRISATKHEISFMRARYTTGLAVILFVTISLTAPELSWAYTFYPAGTGNEIDTVLDFAHQHRDGRYLVEVINPKKGPAWTEASFDARAINSYLGGQGNETISGVFHEASPNVLFTLPTVNAFSDYPDSFGISSVLSDDLDFMAQPLEKHIARARYLGVKYLVIRTPAMKERIGKESGIVARHDFRWWSIYELRDRPSPFFQALPYKPALVVSSLTVKSRRRNEMSFVRLAEEQFADNWFEVLLARSPEMRLDRLSKLNDFGALIVDSYHYGDEGAAFNLLRDYAQSRSLILMASDDKLFQRLQAARADLPKLEIINRSDEDRGAVLEAVAPSYHYQGAAIRQQWLAIRRILENNKEVVNTNTGVINGGLESEAVTIDYTNRFDSRKVPVVISSSFHPNWRRVDGERVYAVTPFNMLTFVDGPAKLSFKRQTLDELALWVSTAVVVLLIAFLFPVPSFPEH